MSAWLAIRRFAAHFLEMCIVMCAGGAVLGIAVFGAATLAGIDLVARSVPLSILLIGIDAAIAMATYMALRGHPVRHNVEMSASALVAAALFAGAVQLGWVTVASFTTWPAVLAGTCGPLCLLMLAVMIARFDHYGGQVASTRVVSSNGDWTCSMHPDVLLSAPGRCPVCDMKLVPLRRRGPAPA